MQQVLGVRGGTLRAQRGKGHLGPPKGLASGHQDRTGGAGAGDDSRSESQMIGQKDRGTGAGETPLAPAPGPAAANAGKDSRPGA